jgi:hypothetical protein
MEACDIVGLYVFEVGFEVILLVDLPLRSSVIDRLFYVNDVKRLT